MISCWSWKCSDDAVIFKWSVVLSRYHNAYPDTIDNAVIGFRDGILLWYGWIILYLITKLYHEGAAFAVNGQSKFIVWKSIALYYIDKAEPRRPIWRHHRVIMMYFNDITMIGQHHFNVILAVAPKHHWDYRLEWYATALQWYINKVQWYDKNTVNNIL